MIPNTRPSHPSTAKRIKHSSTNRTDAVSNSCRSQHVGVIPQSETSILKHPPMSFTSASVSRPARLPYHGSPSAKTQLCQLLTCVKEGLRAIGGLAPAMWSSLRRKPCRCHAKPLPETAAYTKSLLSPCVLYGRVGGRVHTFLFSPMQVVVCTLSFFEHTHGHHGRETILRHRVARG